MQFEPVCVPNYFKALVHERESNEGQCNRHRRCTMQRQRPNDRQCREYQEMCRVMSIPVTEQTDLQRTERSACGP